MPFLFPLYLDVSDPPFVAPSYFKNLARSLLATPLPLLDDLPLPDLMASLSMESDVRPTTLQHVKGIICLHNPFLYYLSLTQECPAHGWCTLLVYLYGLRRSTL